MSQSNQGKITALYCRLSQDDGLDGEYTRLHLMPQEAKREVLLLWNTSCLFLIWVFTCPVFREVDEGDFSFRA